jgi:MFS family permease
VAVLVAGQLMVVLAVASMAVSTPTVQRDLHLPYTDLDLVASWYALPLGALALAAGRLGEVRGRRRIHIAGLVVFAAGSGVVALAPSTGLLLLARAVQGVGAAAASAGAVALLESLGLSARGRAVALTAWFTAGSVGATAGPLIGVLLIVNLGWRVPFFGYAAVALLLACAALLLPEDRPNRAAAPALWRAFIGSLGLIALSKAVEVYFTGSAAERIGWTTAAAVLLARGFLPVRIQPGGLGRRAVVLLTVWVLDAAFFSLAFPALMTLQATHAPSTFPDRVVLACSAGGAVLGAFLWPRVARAVGLRWALGTAAALAGVGLWWVGHCGLASPMGEFAGGLAVTGLGAGGAIAAVCWARAGEVSLTGAGLNRTRGLALSVGTAAVPAFMKHYAASHQSRTYLPGPALLIEFTRIYVHVDSLILGTVAVLVLAAAALVLLTVPPGQRG